MQWPWRFLTPGGRVGRLSYLRDLLITLAIWYVSIEFLLVALSPSPELRGMTSGGGTDASVLYLFLGIAIGDLYLLFAQVAKRLHDTDHSAWWFVVGLVPVVGQLLIPIMAIGLLFVPGKESLPGEER